MSLVGDALRRARRDAGSRYNLPPAQIPGGRRPRRVPAWAAVALTVAAALGGAGIVMLLRAPRGTALARSEPSDDHLGAEPTPVASPGHEAAAGTATSAATVKLPTEGAEPVAAPMPTAAPRAGAEGSAAAPGSDAGNARPVAPSGSERAGAPTSGPAAATPDAGGTKTRVFVVDAELGYAKLHLDYLVYRPSAPFGRINGANVVIGSTVDGFTVESIGPDSITLRDRHGVVVLKTR